jgi:hypothetical protein
MPFDELSAIKRYDAEKERTEEIQSATADESGEIEMYDAGKSQAEGFQALREEVHEQMDADVAERLRTNPVPDEEEIMAGAFREMIEPQVREAIFAMRRKGYATQSSGFGGESGELQVIDGYFDIDPETEEKIRSLGVEVKRGEETGISLSEAYAELSFSPARPDGEEIKETWRQVVESLPQKDRPAPPSISGGQDEFRKKYVPERVDVEKAAIERSLAVESFSPDMTEQMQARLRELASQDSASESEIAKHHGEMVLSDEERAYLDEAPNGKFEKHPVLNGVEVSALDIGKVPADILKRLNELGVAIASFSAIRIAKEVPLHKHTADGEIYFGGSNGTVTLLDGSKKEIGRFELGDKSFAVTPVGEWHAVTSDNERGSTFFGVKFTAKSAS